MNQLSRYKFPTSEHLVGFGLAAILTAIPFASVWYRIFDRQPTIGIIAVCAIAQIVVHLWFFLGIRPRRHAPGTLVSLGFAAVLLLIMIGGTLWIMANLAWRMGH